MRWCRASSPDCDRTMNLLMRDIEAGTTGMWMRIAAVAVVLLTATWWHIAFGDIVVMSKHQFETEFYVMGLSAYMDGYKACRIRQGRWDLPR